MTSESRIKRERKFVPDLLPWLVGAAALALYLGMVKPWVSLGNLPLAVQVAGWDRQFNLLSPLQFLLTYPLRWAPAPWVPLALNAFTAVCAALTLVLLARSIALLPHDRTPQQERLVERVFALLSIRAAWIPPVLAALACGLQLTFWENASVATGEMLNLLVFAYVIRCLLEYRIDGRQSWLSRAAFVYGAGMANNWGMIGFFPLLLVALVWLKQLGFFNSRFLVRMALFGLAGLSLLLVLPLVQALAPDSHVSFWQGLRFVLATHKNLVLTVFNRFYLYRRDVALLLALTSLLPVLVMSIRWRTFPADSSPLGMAVANTMSHVTHVLFLLACLWVTFDPPFSPRQSSRFLALPFPIPFLTLYYLSALAIGYYSGYLLLIFGGAPARRTTLVSFFDRWAHRVIPKVIWALLVLVPVALFYKNFPTIRADSQPIAAQYGSLTAKCLPHQGAVVLSDDPIRLFLLQASLAGYSHAENYVLLSTQALPFGDYHHYLRRRYPAVFLQNSPASPTNEVVDSRALVRMTTALAQSNSLCYLHPSFGYYFEQFYLEPHGLAYQLRFYPSNQISPPSLTESEIEENEKFWKQTEAEVLTPLLAAMRLADQPEKIGVMSQFMESAHLKREATRQAAAIGAYYSRALDYWGVQLQRAGRLADAARCFARALELNPDNVAAEVNLHYNATLRAGHPTPVEVSKSVDERLRNYRTLQIAMNFAGPFDEPDFCYELGREFAAGGNYRQAAQQFARVMALDAANLEARLWMAQLFNLWRLPDKALELVAEIRASPKLMALVGTNQVELLLLEATAQIAKTNVQTAREILASALARYPSDTNLLSAATRIYIAHGHFTNALATVDQLLRLAPNNVDALVNNGFICMQLGAYTDAIPPLTRALSLQTNNYQAMFNRAIAYLQSGELDAAQADYLELNKVFPTAFQVSYGLGEIAYRKKDTNAAIIYYQNYLSNAIPNSAESNFVSARLAELKAGSR